jgi:hypothetical protein
MKRILPLVFLICSCGKNTQINDAIVNTGTETIEVVAGSISARESDWEDWEYYPYLQDYPFEYKKSRKISEKAILANTKGMEFYEKKEYEEAINYFQESIVEDAYYILPHYNLACTLNISRPGTDKVIDEIIAELTITLNLDPETGGKSPGWAKERMREDADLKSLQNNQKFKNLLDNYKTRRLPPLYADGERGYAGLDYWLITTDWQEMGPRRMLFNLDHSLLLENMETGARSVGTWSHYPDRIYVVIDNIIGNIPLQRSRYDVDTKAIMMRDHDGIGYGSEIYFGENKMVKNAFKESDYGLVLQIIEAGFPIDYIQKQDEWGSGGYGSPHYYGPQTVALENKDIPMLRLLIGCGITFYWRDLEKLINISPFLYELYNGRVQSRNDGAEKTEVFK